MELARFILLKSNANNKYLCYTKEKATNQAFLRFSCEANVPKGAEISETEEKAEIESSNSEKIEFHHLKFEVEKAKMIDGLVHIRSCYNNKYLVRKSIENKYMAAVAHEAEEDQSKWCCTLFKPIFIEDANNEDEVMPPLGKSQKIRLLHICKSGQGYIGTSKTTSEDDDHLVVLDDGDGTGSDSSTHLDFTATDVEATAILPEYATFMGPNDKYLMQMLDSLNFFSTEVGQIHVSQRVTSTGPVPQPTSIFVQETNDAWLLGQQDGYILVYQKEQATKFAPIKIDNYIALKCMTNNCFAISRGSTDLLYSNATTLTQASLFRVGEPVLIREIIDATYDLENSRIYNTSSIKKYHDSRSNRGSIEQEGTFEVGYKISKTMTWNHNVTVNMGIKFTWKVGIPKIGEGGLEVDYDQSETFEWGEDKTEEETIAYSQTIKMPPGKKMTLSVVAMQAFCDVPFTCQVRDTMTDGTTREYTKTDGLFVGCNEYDFETIIDEENV